MLLKKQRTTLRDEAVPSCITLSDKLPMPTERDFMDNGRMIAPAVIARVGVMDYLAEELGDLFSDRDPKSIIKVMTTPAALADANHLASGRSAPISVGHNGDVTSENAKELQVGQLEGTPLFNVSAGTLTADIVLNDADAIALVKAGTSQLSSGHDTILVRVTDKDWDCEKTSIRINHVAIVPSGRAGEVAKIADATEATVDEGPAKLVDVQAKLDDTVEKLAATKTQLADALAKATPEAIQTLVDARVAFLAEAATISGEDVSAMAVVDAKRHIVASIVDGDMSKHDDNYIAVRYQILLEDHKLEDEDTDMTAALRNQVKKKVVDVKSIPSKAETARNKMIARNTGNE